jgi:PAS domain S-box-containing protein
MSQPLPSSSGNPPDQPVTSRETLSASAELGLQFEHSRAAYESLVNSLPLSVLIKDTQGRRLFANRAYLEARGVALQDLIGKRDEDLFPPEIAQEYTADDRAVIESGSALHSIEPSVDRQGKPRWIERIKSPIFSRDGTVVGVQLMFWDVTDKVHAEEQLKHERDLLNHLLRHIPDSIYFKDRESHFLRLSEAMAKKFGMPNAAAVEGKTDADIFSEEHARAARADEVQVMESRQPLVDREEKETWHGREDTWCLSTKMPFIDDDGQVIGTFGISRDITDLKKSQDELKKARDAADRANRAKSEFLANMSHEIRTPMNAVIGMSELLAQTRLSDEQRDYVQLIRDSADALLRLLNDILDFSKIEARKLELEAIPFSIRDLMQKTARTLSLRAVEKGLELACRIAPEVPDRLIGDPGRLRQVIINLIGNAIKFTDEGEVVVDVSLGEPCSEDWPPAALPIHISVRDTGIGVPLEKQASILEAFTQADASTTRRFGGTGLGLAISRQLVELMHGKLELESRVGHGTTFFFTVALPKSNEATEDRTLRLEQLGRMPVLVVDDNPTNRRILKEILTTWRFAPELADGGPAALSLIDDAKRSGNNFALVILDCMMPGMDGFELAEKIRQRCSEQQTKLIILSSASLSDAVQRCRELGIARYLNKPVVQSELLDTVLQVMGIEHHVDTPDPNKLPECPPLRVLVAEDGLANQHVALGILRAAGHQAVIAADGREAIACWQNEPFDVILMDMHMPVMDGIEATEHIRAAEAASGQHIPIIALTAAALKEDADACERAGMDAYLAKPIRPRKLQELLAQFAAKRPAGSAASGLCEPVVDEPADASTNHTTSNSTTGTRLSDLLEQSDGGETNDVVDFRAAASRVPGGLKGVRRLTEVFIPECQSLLATLRKEIPGGDIALVQRSAHTLKGSANLFFAKRVHDLARQIESQARSKGIEHLSDDLLQLEGEVEVLLRSLHNFLDLTSDD